MDDLSAQYAALREHFGGEFKEPNLTHVHEYDVANPEAKDMHDLFSKIWRVLSKKNLEDENYLNTHNPFDLISDNARCSVLLPDFTEAPMLLDKLMQELGGKVKTHDRPDYKAFHLHTQKDGINCEIQVHTKETFALKQLTDLHYHKWRDTGAKDLAARNNNPEYLEEQALLTPLCAEVYQRSGFAQVAPAVKELEKHNQPIPPLEIKEALMIVKGAEKLQGELINVVTNKLNEMHQEKAAHKQDELITIPTVEEFTRMLEDTKTR